MDIQNTSIENIQKIRVAQEEYFRSGATLDVKFRKEMLRRFRSALSKWENQLYEALWSDLHKSYEEALLTEISIVKGEIDNHIAHIGKWQESMHSAQVVPVTQLCREGASGNGSDCCAVELSCPAAAESSCGCNLIWLHGSAQAITLCSKRIKGD